ncbi:hypothetical protein SEA_SAMPSON_29 [Gordonia Phage Sampson]|uniref:Tail assembly chaperone n=2 Tax=Zitchvirus TaxID=2948963 RepID=A0A976YEJ2_9CAUD|nr:hypothetical protein SEA_SAMPSON_29 [Gordonia Phage Sampson]UVF61651.1 hypothetical protein SEA_APUNK_30 [Gordonia phage APunk]
MSEQVTIEAQQSFGELRAGDVVTVDRTPYVDRLIKNQRVVVVDDAEPTTTVAPGGDDLVPAGIPKRNASRDDWAEWLAVNTSIVTEGKSRDELLAEFDELTATPPATTDTVDDQAAGAATDSGADGTDGSAGDGTD